METPLRTAKKKKRVKAKESPNSKAMKELKRLGFEAWVVESVIPHTFIKRDAFGWMDILAINGVNTIGIQVTSGGGSKGESNANARRLKVLAEPRALLWIKSGNLCEVWNFDATGALQREEIIASDFEHAGE